MRRGSIAQLVAIGIVCGGGAALVAILIPWLPDPASRQAGRIDFVFWFVTVICIAIFALVAAVIIYSVLKFRAQPGEDMDGPPIHGNTGLEIVWTAVPAALVTAISIVSAIVLAKNDHIPHASAAGKADPLSPLVVDVTHSFWVPEFGQKQDAVPGSVNKLVITPDKNGTYPVICTELCGLGHALMRSRAEVMPAQQFLSWAKGQQKQLGGPAGSSGKAVFTANGCDSCHTFTPAGANKKIGPDLDNLRQEAQRAGQPLEQFIRKSIVDPNAYVEPGFTKGLMPTSFSSLPKAQLDALVSYLAGGAKK